MEGSEELHFLVKTTYQNLADVSSDSKNYLTLAKQYQKCVEGSWDAFKLLVDNVMSMFNHWERDRGKSDVGIAAMEIITSLVEMEKIHRDVVDTFVNQMVVGFDIASESEILSAKHQNKLYLAKQKDLVSTANTLGEKLKKAMKKSKITLELEEQRTKLQEQCLNAEKDLYDYRSSALQKALQSESKLYSSLGKSVHGLIRRLVEDQLQVRKSSLDSLERWSAAIEKSMQNSQHANTIVQNPKRYCPSIKRTNRGASMYATLARGSVISISEESDNISLDSVSTCSNKASDQGSHHLEKCMSLDHYSTLPAQVLPSSPLDSIFENNDIKFNTAAMPAKSILDTKSSHHSVDGVYDSPFKETLSLLPKEDTPKSTSTPQPSQSEALAVLLKVQPREPEPACSYWKVTFDFAATDSTQLSLKMNDLVLAHGDEVNGWQYGRCLQSGKSGWFPASHAQPGIKPPAVPDPDYDIIQS